MLSHTQFPRWFGNSLVVALATTLSVAFFASLVGYTLAKLRFPGRDVIFVLILATLMTPTEMLVIPFGPLRYQGIVNGPNISPLVLQNVARGFPEVPFIVPHFGCGYPRELLHLMWVCGNVYVDTSGSNEWMRWMPYPLDLKSLFAKFLDTVGPRRIIFGTDSSWFPRGFAHKYLAAQTAACRQLGVADADLRLIFAGNAVRLLKLALPEDE